MVMLETGLGGEDQREAGTGVSRVSIRRQQLEQSEEIVRKLNGADGKGKRNLGVQAGRSSSGPVCNCV